MGQRFKWHMFFTSFLPLWISIIMCDIWSLAEDSYMTFVSLKEASAVFQHTSELIKNFLLEHMIEVGPVVTLVTYSIICMRHINKVIRNQEGTTNKPVGKITKAHRANKLTAEFLLAYILPMIAFDYSTWKGIVLFLVYFCVLSFLCIRNNNVYTNIFFELKGYKMYECDIECRILDKTSKHTNCLVISKHNLTQALPRKIQYFDFDNYIYIETGVDKDE